MKNRNYDHLFKFVIVGNSAVGKSSVFSRFTEDTFNENFLSTIGVDFKFKTLRLGDQTIKLQIWDTAGQCRFRTITNTYYKNADCVFMVYDITNPSSFEDIDTYWLNQVQSYADPEALIVLVGNKSDLPRQVSKEVAASYAQLKKMVFLQTSAKTCENIHECFQSVTKILVDRKNQQVPGQACTKGPRIALDTESAPNKTKKGCC